MITVRESVAYDAAFARESCENYGRNYQARISPKSARGLCGMYPMPKPGNEVCIAYNRLGAARLWVSNLGGAYVVRSTDAKAERWPDVFGVTLIRKTV